MGLFERVFGRWTWQSPAWLGRASEGVSRGRDASLAWHRQHPRRLATIAGALVVLALAGAFGWRWYQAQPKPMLVSFYVGSPALTCYTCEPKILVHPVRVQFSESVAPLAGVGKPVDAKALGLGMSPAIAGEWRWDDDRNLVFSPAEDWPIGQRFEVRMPRKGMIAAHVRLERYEFDFTTAAFEARIEDTEFYQDPQIAANKKVVVTVGFSHAVDPERLESRIALHVFHKETDTREVEVAAPHHSVVFDKLKLKAFIHSDRIEVPVKEGRLQLNIAPGLQAARGGNLTEAPLTTGVTVPGLNSLAIRNVAATIARDERNEPQQVLLVGVSSSVNERDMPGSVHAWLLPERHPDPKVQAQLGSYFNWTEAYVTPDVIAASSELELRQEPGELTHYEDHGFRYAAKPGRQLYVKVSHGLKSFGGYLLEKDVERIITVPEYPRELQLLSKGSLLALSGDKRITFFSRNVRAIKVEVGRLLPRQIQHLVTQSSGAFSRPEFRNWAFSDVDITERFEKVIRLPAEEPATAHYEAFDLAEYLGDAATDRRGIFLVRAQAWDPDDNEPLEGSSPASWNSSDSGLLSDARLIVTTDLGLLAKRAKDGSQDVFVQSIASGEPASGVSVEVLGRNGLPVMSETTGADGHVHFDSFDSLHNEREATLYVARRLGDSSFMPIAVRDRALDMSRFDVGGVVLESDVATLSAYLFSDRGLYRPGEQIRLASIVRSQDWTRAVTGIPLLLEVADPRGVVVRRENFTPGSAGLTEILHDTRLNAPAGTYTFTLSTHNRGEPTAVIGTTTVQVRDFQPDRLRMATHFSAESPSGWVSPEQLDAQVQLDNLYGTPAENRRVTTVMTLTPALPQFDRFPDFRFSDPQFAREGFTETLADTTTNDKGGAELTLNLQRFARATYRVHLLTQGFESNGGRGVTAEAVQLVSNMPYLVGYRPDGDLGYVTRGAQRGVEWIAVGPDLERKAAGDLKLERYELRYVSVLMRQKNDTYRYESRRKETLLDTRAFSLPAAGSTLALGTDTPGQFAYVLRDADEQTLARVDYQVTGEANVTRMLDKNAELEIGLSKSDYLPGEDVEVSLRAPYAGSGLITIEREGVYAWRWFKASTNNSVQHITLPKTLEGNAYVSVSFVRDPGSPEIYTSPLSYGVKPFSIDTNSRRNAIEVQAPATVKPGEALTVRFSTQKPTRIVLFAVDEGILQVSRQPAPDPLAYFFRKRALQVQSTQILDLILPAFRQLGLGAAPGGDREGLIGRNLNPFRRKGEPPVAWWSGVVDADTTVRELRYNVPDYFNGKLKLFAVAVSQDRVGVEASDVTVRGDFILNPTAPTAVTPGDEFEVGVGVANNLRGSGPGASLKLTLATDAGLTVVGQSSQQISVAEGHEGVAHFRVKALDRLGASDLRFTAVLGASSLTRKVDLSVRPATPHLTLLSAGSFTATRDIDVGRNFYPEYRRLNTGVSLLPLSLSHGLVSYLANFSYQCTEQIVSQAMPAIVLASRPEFGYVKTQNGADLGGLVSELRARQNDMGAYKLWPGGDTVDEFVSIYAQHLLIEWKERGGGAPADLIDKGNAYLRALAVRDGNNLTDERNSAYAIFLLTRQGQRTTAQISTLRRRLETRYEKEWRSDLVSAWLAASLSLMKQDSEAERLMTQLRFEDTASLGYYSSMTRDGQLLYLTARYFPSRLTRMPAQVLETLAKRIDSNAYNTLSIGTTLLALDAYATATSSQRGALSIGEILDTSRAVRVLKLPDALMPTTTFTERADKLRFGNESKLPGFYFVDQSGFELKPPTQAISKGLEIIREYTRADGKPAAEVRLGEEVTVHVKFRSLTSARVENLAVVDLLPGGFELVVPEAGGSRDYYGWSCQICTDSTSAELQYADMREDRVVFYASANPEIREVSYVIKATNIGNYVLPPAFAESMYERGTLARSVIGRMSVVRAP